MFFVYSMEEKSSNTTGNLIAKEDVTDMVIIKKKTGKNVTLIDEFLKGVENGEAVNIVIDNNNTKLVIKYVPAKNAEKGINLNEDARKYGYYEVMHKDGSYEIYETTHYAIKLVTTADNVSLVLRSYLVNEDDKVLCEYSSESVDYDQKYWIKFEGYKDVEDEDKVKKIAEIPGQNGEVEYSVFTLGGDVTIGFDKDYTDSMTLENALESGRLDLEELIEIAQNDSRHGICEVVTYTDGGTAEYCYPSYTILKFNTRVGKKDLYIGHKGIISGFAKYRGE